MYTIVSTKTPSNSSINLYTSIICISGHIIPKNSIQTSAFHPTMHENIESILMPNVQVYHHLKTLTYQNQTQSHLTDTSYLIDFASMENKLSFSFPRFSFFFIKLLPCLKGVHPVVHEFVFVFAFVFGKGLQAHTKVTM